MRSRKVFVVRAQVSIVSASLILGLAAMPAGAAKPPSLDPVLIYAEQHGISEATAAAELRMIDEAGFLEEQLHRDFPNEFAGLWVDHEPSFHVVVAMAGADQAKVDPYVPEDMRSIFQYREHTFSLAYLNELAGRIQTSVQARHNLNIDVRQNDIELEVLPSDVEATRADIKSMPADSTSTPSENVRTTGVPKLGEPSALIYGGLWLSGANSGTSGFAVHKNGTTTDGIVTAGHLSNSLSYNGQALSYQSGIYSGSVDAQWMTTPNLTDDNLIYFGGGTEYITARKSYSQQVVGGSVCKYGQTGGYDCGTIESKTWAPSYIPNVMPLYVLVIDCGNDMSDPGDSGGPVFWASTAYGIVEGSVWGGIGCWEDKLVYNSVTHFQDGLGVTVKTQ
jgi:hypothetical protein